MRFPDAQCLAAEALLAYARGHENVDLTETAMRACASVAESDHFADDERAAASFLLRRLHEERGAAAYLDKAFSLSDSNATQKGIDWQIAVLRGSRK